MGNISLYAVSAIPVLRTGEVCVKIVRTGEVCVKVVRTGEVCVENEQRKS